MGSSLKNQRRLFVLLILFVFLTNEAVSLLAAPKLQGLSHTEVYQYTEGNPAIPSIPSETFLKLPFVFAAIAIFLSAFVNIRSKVRKELKIPLAVRNPFYRYVSIHAP